MRVKTPLEAARGFLVDAMPPFDSPDDEMNLIDRLQAAACTEENLFRAALLREDALRLRRVFKNGNLFAASQASLANNLNEG